MELIKNKKIFYFSSIIVAVFFVFPVFTFAAVRTWDGGGSDGTCGGVAGDGNKWSCAANWSSDTTPTSSDSVVFDGTSTKDATIDSSFQGTVTGFTISSGYSGTITQARTVTINGSFSQAAGTFVGATQTIDLNGSFSLSGGVFTSTSGTWTISDSFTVTNSPTFNANSGTVTFDSTNTSTVSCNGITFNLVTVVKGYTTAFNISSGCSVPFGNTPSSTATITNSGTITAGTGTWTISGSLINNGTLTSTLTKIDINTNTGAAGNFTSSGGSITMTTPALEVESVFTYTAGTVPNFDLTLNGIWSGTLTCGTVTLNSIAFSKSSSGVTISVASSCNLPSLGNNPSSTGIITNNGTINAGTGTWTITGGLVNNGTISTSLSRIDINASTGAAGAFTANIGSSLIMSSPAQLDVDSSYTYSGGTVPNFDLVSTGGWAGTITCGSGSLNSIVFTKTNGTNIVTIASSCNLPSLGNSPTTSGSIVNNGTMTVGTGTWTSNGGITNNGTINTSLSRLDVNWNSGTDYFISNSGSTLTMSTPTMTIATAFVYNGGTLPTNIDLTLDSVANTLTCGSYTLGSLTISLVNSAFTVTPGSDCTIAGNFSMTTGNIANPASAKTWTISGNISGAGGPTFGGSNLTLEMNGSVDKTISSSITIGAKLKVNKSVGNSVTMASNIVLGSTLEVTSGTFDQGATYNLTTGGATTISSSGTWSNTGTGDITLGGNVTNSGIITLDGSGSSCGGTDAIVINSSASPTQRTWSGAGTFTLYDLSVSNMAGSMTARSSTDTSNNAWTFLGCNNSPSTPSISGATYTSGSWGNNSQPTLSFTLSDSDVSDTVQYQIQIDDSSDFASPVVDYTSGLESQGSFTFTIGQVAGTGTYTVGSSGQSLSDTLYYWRVRAFDNAAAGSSYSTANSGSVAFKVDTVAPEGGAMSSGAVTGSTAVVSVSGVSDSASGINGYTFENQTRSTSSGSSSSDSWSETGLTPGVTYQYRVTIADLAGNSSILSISIRTLASGNGQPDLFGKVNVQQNVKTQVPPSLFVPVAVGPITNQQVVPLFTKTINTANRGEDSRRLQIFLNTHGYVVAKSGPGSPGLETGVYGTLTQKAVQKFQCSNDIVCKGSPTTTGYGIVGPKTLSMINRLINK